MASIRIKLLFDTSAGQAARFYTSIFENSSIELITNYPSDKNVCIQCGLDAAYAGEVMNADFVLDGRSFTAINGKNDQEPLYRYNEAAVLQVYCNSPQELFDLAQKLTISPQDHSGPDPITLQDKFGVFWRLVIAKIPQREKIIPLFTFSDPAKVQEATEFYGSVFNTSPLLEANTPNHVALAIMGQTYEFTSRSNAPSFTEALSSIVLCESEAKIEQYWQQLIDDGGDGLNRQGGAWLVDRYGIWWQLLLSELSAIMSTDIATQKFAIDEMEKSETIDIKQLKQSLEENGLQKEE